MSKIRNFYNTVEYLKEYYPLELSTAFKRMCQCADTGSTWLRREHDVMLGVNQETYLESVYWSDVRVAFWNTLFDSIEDESIKMELFLQGLL